MSDLGTQAKLSVLWNTGFNLFRDILQFLVMLILVRMISPSSYGEFALVSSVMTFIHVFSFNTFIQHVLQVRDDSEVNYQRHFTFGFILQTAMFIITNMIAFLLTWFDFYAVIATYLHVLSIVFFLELFSELYRMQLQRDLDWKHMRILHGIGLILGSILAIGIAYLGGGVYALIIPGFISNIPFIYELVVIKKWKPNWEWNYSDHKETISFSYKRILSGIAVNSKPMLENSLISSTLSFAQLGFYNRAIGLATILVQKFALQLTSSIYPVLTKVEPFTQQFKRISGLILTFTLWFIAPLAFLLVMMSENFVVILYGEKWLKVIPYLGPAAIIMALTALKHVVYSLMLSSHFEKICAIFDVVLLVASLLILFFILPFGLLQYLYAQIVMLICSVLFLLILSFIKGIFNLNSIYLAIFPPFLGIIISYLILEVLTYKNEFIEYPFAQLFLNCLIIGASYILVLRIFFKTSMSNIIYYLPLKKYLKKYLIIN